MQFLEHLVKVEILPREILDNAVRQYGRKQKTILQALPDQIAIDPQTLLKHMSVFFKLPIADLDAVEKNPEAMQLISFETAKRYGVFPVKVAGGKLTLAISDPADFFTLDDLRAISGCRVECVLSTSADIHSAIEKYYRLEESLAKSLKELSGLSMKIDSYEGEKAISPVEDYHSPISKTVQHILEDAIQRGASDIHFEPQESVVELRYRIDGELATMQKLPSRFYPALVARVKILSQMDIAEKRKPQDGRARMIFRGRKIDFRISTLSTIFGEKIVIRLLDQESLAVDSFDALCLDPIQSDAYLKAITSKQGIVLITGPTGSGKTTTLYTSLNYIKSHKNNITTIEDPIEYLLGGVNQTQINPKIGVTFATSLRSILRQDPDVILVGEIRDRETADMAFRSSLTGHLVLSTLHTNSALGAVTRLYELGLEPYLVGSALSCVVAQRLIRMICTDCRESYCPSANILEPFKSYLSQDKPLVFYRGRGCAKCDQSGLRGRIAVFEVLPIVDEIKSAISNRVSEQALCSKARSQDFRTMAESAVEKAMQGIIQLEEALQFMSTYEKKENDLFMKLSEFIETHQKERLLVIKNDDLTRKIMLNVSPEDYVVIEASKDIGISEFTAHDNHVVLPPALLAPGSEIQITDHEDLKPSENHSKEDPFSEKRRHPRIIHDFIINYRPSGSPISSNWEASVVKNLSAAGCYFCVSRTHRVGELLDIHVQLPITKDTTFIKGAVRHCQKLGVRKEFYFLGISFAQLESQISDEFRQVVSFFLNKKIQPKNSHKSRFNV